MSLSAFEQRGNEVEAALESLKQTESDPDELAEAIEADQRETDEKLAAALKKLRGLSKKD